MASYIAGIVADRCAEHSLRATPLRWINRHGGVRAQLNHLVNGSSRGGHDRDRSTPTAPRISCVVPACQRGPATRCVACARSAPRPDALRPAWRSWIVDDGSADVTPCRGGPGWPLPGIRRPAAVAQSSVQGGGAHRRLEGRRARRRRRADGCSTWQHLPALIPRMLEAPREGAQMVCMAAPRAPTSRRSSAWAPGCSTARQLPDRV